MAAKPLRIAEPWMTLSEKRLAKRLSGELAAFFAANGIELSPLLRLRARDVVLGAVLIGSLESAYAGEGLPPGDGGEGGDALKLRAFFLDVHGKAQERLRKAVRELEDHCARVGTPVDVNLANGVKPVMEKAPAIFQCIAELQAELRARRDRRGVRPSEGDPLPRDKFV